MAVTSASLPQFVISRSRASLQQSADTRKIIVAANYSVAKFASQTVRSLSRRLLLFTGFVPILSNGDLALGAPIPQIEEPEIIRIQYQEASWWHKGSRTELKMKRTIAINFTISRAATPIHCLDLLFDIVDGEGQAANEGDVVVFNYVCRRSNGYFVYSTVDQFTGEAMPVTLPLDESQIIKGLKDVLVGMKVGGKRRALIPPSMGYVNENLKPTPEEFGPRRSLQSHVNEPLIFEVQLLKVL